ncbi:MAG: c-type cytochrome [Thermomicrobiales bacterium]
MRQRATLLVTIIGIAVIAVACGRASEADINQALGITPTPTQSTGDLATAAARAAAAATQQAAAQASGSPAVAQGDVTQGSTFYRITCAQCHRPDGSGQGPALAEANSPILGFTVEQFDAFLRGDPSPGGIVHTRAAFTTAELSDKRITDIYAYLQSEAEQAAPSP